jgi:hypothetical protein
MLARIPPPTVADVAARASRTTMNRSQRWSLVRRYAVGLALLVTMYLLVTVLRSFRADFATELWHGLGAPAQPATFSQSEICVALGVLIVNGCAALVRDNQRAFFLSLGTCGAGFCLLAAALVGHRSGLVDGFSFMVLIGLGLYLPYVAIHTTVFERLLAMTRDRGNIGFLMYLADAFGYVAVMLLRNAMTPAADMVDFFTAACWGAAVVSAFCLVGSGVYFGSRRARPAELVVAGEAA